MRRQDAATAGLRALENQGGRHPDPYLELLRLGTEASRDTVVVTLFLAGATVTGTVITLDQWERLVLKELKQQATGVRDVVGGAMKVLDQRAQDQDGERPDADSPFVHLRDVTYRAGGDRFTISTWRGPISGISGWAVGEPGRP